MQYQVVWPKMNLFSAEGEPTVYRRGQILPDGADPQHLSMLATVGAVQVVAETPAAGPLDAPSLPDPFPVPNEPTDGGELVRPSREANKDEWVAYASDERNPDRIPEARANSMSKADLVKKYGG